MIVHVPAFAPETMSVQVGPEPLAAANVAIGEMPAQLLVWVNVPV